MPKSNMTQYLAYRWNFKINNMISEARKFRLRIYVKYANYNFDLPIGSARTCIFDDFGIRNFTYLKIHTDKLKLNFVSDQIVFKVMWFLGTDMNVDSSSTSNFFNAWWRPHIEIVKSWSQFQFGHSANRNVFESVNLVTIIGFLGRGKRNLVPGLKFAIPESPVDIWFGPWISE